MQVSELIRKLQEFVLEHGDSPVEVFNSVGELGDPELEFISDRRTEPKPVLVIES